MSTDSNPHYAQARVTEAYYARNNVAPDADVIALGQLEATLALAYEQRTANLIAVATYIGQHGCKVHKDITAQIDDRLGLK